ncbi:MAG: DUF4445 domain-containing protein [Lachnospiraceae bacterium]|nr:DUF4445 domain-containing protein [Lachnospiraceae bacterium]
MKITVKADKNNDKHILTLLEQMGYSLPCNCHGQHHCNGKLYSFDCSLIPKEPITITLPDTTGDITGIALEDMVSSPGIGDTLLIDLGTTTVALALMEKNGGTLRQTLSFSNPQRTYGADIIARIQAACSGSLKDLRQTIISALTRQVSLLCQKNHQRPEQITSCLIGGNTTMIHLLMGYDCSGLAASPFSIHVPSPEPFYYKNCKVTILPWLSAFVGGDITAGLFACHLTEKETPTLFLDLGTNGEMALFYNNTLYTAATAAGPAFEGGGLSCGCPAIPGAICGVHLKPLRPTVTTIDNKLPVGICGCGAIQLCAELIRKNYVSKEGILSERFPAEGIFLSSSAEGTSLFLTPEDFRNIQLAAAAIAAGIETLSHTAGIAPEEITDFYLGGGFGFYLNPADCQTLRMFSSVSPDVMHPMGNTCLRGLWEFAVKEPDTLFIPPVNHVNLAESSYFEKQFIHHMTYSE